MDFIKSFFVSQLSNITAQKGLIMISVDYSQLLSIALPCLAALCSVLIWCVRTVSTATATWGEVTGAIHGAQEEIKKLGETIRAIESEKDSNKAEIQTVKAEIHGVKTEIAYMQTQFLHRIEILDTLKKTEQFFGNIVLELQIIAGRPINVQVPDLQTTILRRQQKLDDTYAAGRK